MYFNKFEKKNKSFSEPIQKILIRVLSTGRGWEAPKKLSYLSPPKPSGDYSVYSGLQNSHHTPGREVVAVSPW